jgi:2-methylisocitrate lyase-like PEP mutase family enzyme
MDLRARLRQPPILVAPGVYDPLSALIAAEAGCEAVFLSGSAVAMAQLGCPDFGYLGPAALADLTARITDRIAMPLFVDGDQGFGNAANVQRLVRALERAGAAAVQIEDQLAVKPADQLRARPLVSAAEMAGKIDAALDARSSPAFLISARTDAASSLGLNSALDRLELYLERGADLLFAEGVQSADDATALAQRFAGRAPLVVNLLEGSSPFADAAQADAAGYALALFPVSAIGAAAHALCATYVAIAESGSSAAVSDQMLGLADLNALVGTEAEAARLARYAAAT